MLSQTNAMIVVVMYLTVTHKIDIRLLTVAYLICQTELTAISTFEGISNEFPIRL